jgi:hypothetical protein
MSAVLSNFEIVVVTVTLLNASDSSRLSEPITASMDILLS